MGRSALDGVLFQPGVEGLPGDPHTRLPTGAELEVREPVREESPHGAVTTPQIASDVRNGREVAGLGFFMASSVEPGPNA